MRRGSNFIRNGSEISELAPGWLELNSTLVHD
jgi:hypothetical protein